METGQGSGRSGGGSEGGGGSSRPTPIRKASKTGAKTKTKKKTGRRRMNPAK